MYHFLIDLKLVKQIWNSIEKIDDPRILDEKCKVRIHSSSLLDAALSESTVLNLPAVVDASALPPKQLAEESVRVVVDVVAFVSDACLIFDLVTTFRQLTDEEKESGKALTSLLRQVQTLVPGESYEKLRL